MAAILESPLSKSKTKTRAVKVDMTPMVDLGFLLIAFFIFTTTLMEPNVTKLLMPEEGGFQHIYAKTLLTAIVDKDKVLIYEGALDKGVGNNKVIQTNYDVKTGLGHFIRQKQKDLESINRKEELMVAIKPLPSASYQDVINALDEMLINKVSRYGIMNPSEEEKQLIVSRGQHQ